MRLFVAVTPPAEVVAELRHALAPLQTDAGDLRWIPDHTWHLTLAFLGQVGEQRLPVLTERLGRVAARRPAPTLALGPAGRFDGRVLWMSLTGDRTHLERLAASAAAAARRSKIPIEDRPFRPHLTVARSRGRAAVDLKPYVDRLADFAGKPWVADELQLMRSHLGRAVRYEVLDTWSLRPA